jgi:hypothetical protein
MLDGDDGYGNYDGDDDDDDDDQIIFSLFKILVYIFLYHRIRIDGGTGKIILRFFEQKSR